MTIHSDFLSDPVTTLDLIILLVVWWYFEGARVYYTLWKNCPGVPQWAKVGFALLGWWYFFGRSLVKRWRESR